MINKFVYYGGNQVRMVTDAATTDYGHPAEYRDGAVTWYEKNHDKNGNMTKDLNKNILSITWNSLNLPQTITYSTGHRVYYTYDAMGRKQRTTYQTAILPAAGVLPQSGIQIPDEPGGLPEIGGDRGGNGPLAATPTARQRKLLLDKPRIRQIQL